MAATKHEPVFGRQEQAVVYFFSRYWEQIEPFCHGRLSHIQTQFPDASMEYAAAGKWQAIEFEYALSSFDHHRERRSRKILNEDYDSLAIVYWEEDTDRDQLGSEIRERCAKLEKVEFVDCRRSSWISSRIRSSSGVHASANIPAAVSVFPGSHAGGGPGNCLVRRTTSTTRFSSMPGSRSNSTVRPRTVPCNTTFMASSTAR